MKRNDFTEITKALRNATFQLFVVILPLIAFCVIYAEAIMVVVFEKYIASADIFRFYVLGTIWGLFIPQAIILGKGKSYVQARFGAIQLLFNLLLSLLLVYEIGILGPALGSFIGGFIYLLFQVGYCKRAFGLGWSHFLPSRAITPVLAVVICYGVVGLLSRFWLDMFGALWLGLIGLGAIYILNFLLVRKRLQWV